MKRFIIDFLLILLLVMIGSLVTNENSIEGKIDDYEQSLIINENNQTNGNKATHIIKSSGEMIENVLEISIEVISSIFKAVIE